MRKIVLMLLAALILRYCVDWAYFSDPAYRHIQQFSQAHEAAFTTAYRQAASQKQKILLKNLTDFEWDVACGLGGYAHLREDMALKHAYGADLPELAAFSNNREGESALVFLRQGKVVAVFQGGEADLEYTLTPCGAHDTAYLFFADQQSNFEHIKVGLKNDGHAVACKHEPCDLVFVGNHGGD